MAPRTPRSAARGALCVLVIAGCAPRTDLAQRPARPGRTAPKPRITRDATQTMALSADQCHETLRAAGVPFSVPQPPAPGTAPDGKDPDGLRDVAQPVRLTGPVAGVRFTLAWSKNPAGDRHGIWDCRLVATMVPLARWLAFHGVTEVRYFSALRGRPGDGAKRRSQHARGLAVDLLGYKTVTSEALVVVEDHFPKGTLDACGTSPRGPLGERPDRLYTAFTCFATESRLVHTLLTPDHDEAHHNHLHLDLKPDQESPAKPYVSLATNP